MASPQSRDAQTSFLISNLLLDLDAYEVAGVRPYDSQEEDRLTTHYKTTGRWGEVEDDMQELVKTLNQGRWNAEKLVLHPAHPKRITDSDIMAAALRPPAKLGAVYTPSKGAHISATYNGGSEEDEMQEKYDIQALNHAHPKPDRNALARSSIPKTVSGSDSSSGNELRRTIDFGDSTLRQSDFMEQVRQANGVPKHAVHNDEQHIRWMLLRQHNSAFVADKTRPPATKDIAAAIRSVQEQNGNRTVHPENIASIRRIIFHALNSGSSLIGNGSRDGRESNVALQVQESIRAVLAAHPRRKHLFFETLTFANNLSSRLQAQSDKELSLMVLCLRLHATAGLGYVRLMATYLDAGLGTEALHNGESVLGDVGAVLASLDINFKQMKELQSVENRLLLFRILTGHTKTGPAQGESIRKLILSGKDAQSRDFEKQRLSVFISYVKLIGRIGGFHSLWSEWRMAQQMVRGSEAEGKKAGDAARKRVMTAFKLAVRHGQAQRREFPQNAHGGFEESAKLDGVTIAQSTESPMSSRREEHHLMQEEFENMMNLPFDKWLEKTGWRT